ncbi:hypothetical protein H5410_023344 [Solanum commersonii]|uniref:Uncharacterized protein n=1 Tax=Solanum commersonii TaxID=4109 RepID=A0A9J5ZIW1_SOLCO|nr:hypothetical protein H5410_023344 [Solanum commersonii]
MSEANSRGVMGNNNNGGKTKGASSVIPAKRKMVCEKTKMPLNFRTDSLPTAQLSKGITRSYELGIEQTRWRWKDSSKGFPNITGTTPRSS